MCRTFSRSLVLLQQRGVLIYDRNARASTHDSKTIGVNMLV